MVVGITGTSRGPTPRQHDAMRYFLSKMPMTRFVHGAAPGVDTLAHHIVRRFHPDICIEVHPSNLPTRSSILTMPMGNMEVWPEQDPLERDRVMVGRVWGLLAVPNTDVEVVSSGTWSTVRYGREIGLPVYLVTQSGRIVRDGDRDGGRSGS